jgi:hypothetical protein
VVFSFWCDLSGENRPALVFNAKIYKLEE